MTTSPVVTITEEMVAELERFLGFGGEYMKVRSSVLQALLAERAAMQSQIKAGIVTQENLDLYRKDALRYQWLSKRISVSQYHVLGAELSSNTVEGVGEAIDQAMQEQQP